MVLEIIAAQAPDEFRISVELHQPLYLATCTNTLLIDCSSHRGAVEIFVLTQMVLEIIEVQCPNGFPRIGSELLHQPLYLEIQACYSEIPY